LSKGREATGPAAVVRASPADAAAIARLIEPGFARFIAPTLGDVGRVAFRLYVTEKALRGRLEQGAVAWCALHEATAVGYAELRGRDGRPDGIDHLTLLFTAVAHQGRGIARCLMRTLTAHLLAADPPVAELTVNASAYALPIYQRLGFCPTADAGELDGIVATPMRLVLSPASPSVASPTPPPSASSARTAADRGARER
jgi:ribosomal protein S18 acetylase RimI-like enzyme